MNFAREELETWQENGSSSLWGREIDWSMDNREPPQASLRDAASYVMEKIHSVAVTLALPATAFLFLT